MTSQGQTYGRNGLRRYALAAAGEAQAIGRRGFDADPVSGDVEECGDVSNHRRAVRADFRAFADDRHIDGSHDAAACANKIGGVAQKLAGRSAAPVRVAWRKMLADVPGANRAKHGVGQRMEPDISVGMSDETRIMRDADPANDDLVAGTKGVDIETLSDAHITKPRRKKTLGSSKILGGCDFQIRFMPGNH